MTAAVQTPFRVAWDNLLDSSNAVLSVTSAAAGYPVTLVQSYQRSYRWRSTSLANQTITLDNGSAQTISCVVLWDHNLTTSATVTVTVSSDNVTYEDFNIGTPTAAGKLIIFGPTVERRYLKILIADASNPNAYLSVGRVFVGDYYETEYNYSDGWTIDVVNLSRRVRGPAGNSQSVVAPSYKKISLSMELMTTDDRDAFIDIVEDCGINIPMWIMLDIDFEPDKHTFYVTLDEQLSRFSAVERELHNFPLVFVEEL